MTCRKSHSQKFWQDHKKRTHMGIWW